MPPKSLADLAATACIKNIRHIDSVGDYLPYESVHRVLSRVENANQLRQIEINSPQVEGHTAALWLKIIERDFPMEFKAEPYQAKPDAWHQLWKKYKRDHDMALAESEAKLREALAGLQETKQKEKSIILESKDLPRMPKKRKLLGSKDGTTSTMRFNSGSRTKTNTGASVMRKVRREVSEIARIHGSLSRPTAKPGPSNTNRNQVRMAPQTMLNDRKRAAQPAFRSIGPVPERSTVVQEFEQHATFMPDTDDDSEDEFYKIERPKVSKSGKLTVPSLPKRGGSPERRMSLGDTSPPSRPSSLAAPKKKGKGLLSNSYKPNALRNVRTQDAVSRPKTETTKPDKVLQSTVSDSKSQPHPAPRALPQVITKHSPPLSTTGIRLSPPPITHEPEYHAGPSRKRKPVNLFMRPAKRNN